MAITCPKCQTINQAATGEPNETCPHCGVIYARATAVQAQRRVAESVRASLPSRVQEREQRGPGFAERFFWYACVLGCVAALVQLAMTFNHELSAPQQAASAGMALALAVIPYCLARTIQQLMR